MQMFQRSVLPVRHVSTYYCKLISDAREHKWDHVHLSGRRGSFVLCCLLLCDCQLLVLLNCLVYIYLRGFARGKRRRWEVEWSFCCVGCSVDWHVKDIIVLMSEDHTHSDCTLTLFLWRFRSVQILMNVFKVTSVWRSSQFVSKFH